jgi:hypothetical protein
MERPLIQTGAVAQEKSQCHFFILREFVVWNFPEPELSLHIFVKKEMVLFNKCKRCSCRDRLADRATREQCIG